MIKYKDLKKNDEVKTTQLGPPVTGKLLESPVQGRGVKRTILIMSNGSEVGAFNDHGSVYAHEVKKVKVTDFFIAIYSIFKWKISLFFK